MDLFALTHPVFWNWTLSGFSKRIITSGRGRPRWVHLLCRNIVGWKIRFPLFMRFWHICLSDLRVDREREREREREQKRGEREIISNDFVFRAQINSWRFRETQKEAAKNNKHVFFNYRWPSFDASMATKTTWCCFLKPLSLWRSMMLLTSNGILRKSRDSAKRGILRL